MKQILREISGNNIPISCLTDGKSLYDNLNTTHAVTNKRLEIDLCYIRDYLERKEIESVQWIPTQEQLADGLTKRSVSSRKLIHAIGGQALPSFK